VFDHVTIRASDLEASRRFYDTVLGVLGLREDAGGDYTEWGDFSVVSPATGEPPTRRLHIAFFAPTHELVDEFWRVGTAAGYRSDGEPGLRPRYSEDYYGSFLLDPDGNSVEAVSHGNTRALGAIDHLWLRTRDLDGIRRFYEALEPHAPLDVHASSDRVRLAGSGGSLSFVPGEPSVNVHLAFPAETNQAVDEFHRALVGAGYADHGRPGERPEYHDGYYGAFVLDPDGHNVELVNHNR
jgi:catechol 2,3-dioxygenase-like lactoylglutathione lyase family enzyme